MEQKLNEWFCFLKDNNRLSSANKNTGTGGNEFFGAEIQTLGDTVLSLAELVGDNKAQLQQADKEINDLFIEYGASNADFINKLQASPVTGMAAILCACQRNAGFSPEKGQNTLAQFNQFVTTLTKCPLVRIEENKAFNAAGTFTNKKEVMPDSITQNFIFEDSCINNENLTGQIQKCLDEMGNNTYKLVVYNMQTGGDLDAYLEIHAGTIEVTCTAGILKSYKFSALAKGFSARIIMEGANWRNNASHIINSAGFAPISQWIQTDNVLSL
ncbi:hypothetical protein LY28_00252 [Ruminiclostridium sufflavum DSM 19573]|uniref:Uncharacterized protein n=1 Tax=Ruminiclostridium sufflavum DSM 19573 TaxID=1121337 RepID=A0A318XRR9_9FIRM|nr:hypothetical protein [Ruminiclostridium sufflavum]PYG90369.1 hypothetical protein LY28_00252 [Ruminiclostridium sufflavum DSM 19573]